MRLGYLLLLILLMAPAEALGQACVPSTTPVPIIPGTSRLTFQSADHNATTGGVVTDYLAEVFQVGGTTTPVTTWTIAKSAVTPITGTGVPAGCFQTPIPALATLDPANQYAVRITARGPGGNAPSVPSTNPFFLATAPRAITNSVLVNPGS